MQCTPLVQEHGVFIYLFILNTSSSSDFCYIPLQPHYVTAGNTIHNPEIPTDSGLARSPSLLDLYQITLQEVELLATSFGSLGNFSTSQSKGPDN